jgi:hypothetical protein
MPKLRLLGRVRLHTHTHARTHAHAHTHTPEKQIISVLYFNRNRGFDTDCRTHSPTKAFFFNYRFFEKSLSVLQMKYVQYNPCQYQAS